MRRLRATAARAWRKARATNEFGANAALTALTNGLIGIVGILTGVLAARLLGPQGRGELAAIQSWGFICAILAPLGLMETVVYYGASQPDRASVHLGSATALALMSSVPFMLVAWLAMPLFLHAQAPAVIREARFYLLLVPIYALVFMPLHALRGRREFGIWNWLRFLTHFVWLEAFVAAYLIGRVTPSFIARSYLLAIASLIVPLAIAVARRIPGSYAPRRSDFPRLLRFGLPCVFTTIPLFLNLRLDQMLIAAFLPARQLGLYVAAVALGGTMAPLLSAIASTLFPAVASLTDAQERARVFARSLRLAVVLSAGCGLIAFALAPWAVIILFGQSFRPAIAPALVLIPAGAVAALNGVAEEGLRALGHPTEALRGEFTGLVVTVISLATLLPTTGIMGAAIASLLGYLSVACVLIGQACKLTGTSLAMLLVPRGVEIREIARSARAMMREAVA